MNNANNRAMNRIALAAASLAGALTLAACSSSGGGGTTNTNPGMGGHSATSGAMTSPMPGMGGTGSPGPAGAPATGPHNSADVSFATDMIPHHAQAVTMADMAATAATTTGVRTLAATIKAAQAPEIEKMSGWLTGWHKPVPATTYRIGSMGGMAMRGMMSDHDMMRLNRAHGVGFDRMWLTMMVAHHQGAVTMAKTELAHGANPDAMALARSIIASQSAQIQQMRTMLGHLPS